MRGWVNGGTHALSARPWVWRAACKMVYAFRLSYRIAWTNGGSEEGCNKHSGWSGFPGGCFSLRMLNVDREHDSPIVHCHVNEVTELQDFTWYVRREVALHLAWTSTHNWVLSGGVFECIDLHQLKLGCHPLWFGGVVPDGLHCNTKALPVKKTFWITSSQTLEIMQ